MVVVCEQHTEAGLAGWVSGSLRLLACLGWDLQCQEECGGWTGLITLSCSRRASRWSACSCLSRQPNSCHTG